MKNIKSIVLHQVNKFMYCGSRELGYSFYSRDNCNSYMYVPFTCKSRFCSSCGINKFLSYSHKITSKCLKVKHRHIVFTISHKLKNYFLKDRLLLNVLFESVSKTLLSWFKSISKFNNYTSGIISVLHSFGRDLKWNLNIHVIITEGAIDKNNNWKDITNIPYIMLRKRFMGILLSLISKVIVSRDFKMLKNKLYKEYSNGFYVYAKKEKSSNTRNTLKYITRYISRPVMAESRILNYDGENVTFYYIKHEDNSYTKETISALEFIKRLIIHIPEKYFNLIRYYGIYANSSKVYFRNTKHNAFKMKHK